VTAICLQVDDALVRAGAVDDGGGDACVALVSHISADLPWHHLAWLRAFYPESAS
jgi:hypothetical protein